MNAKWQWCISTIIFILTFLGVVNQQQAFLPNQEIVLQFDNANIAVDTAENTIAIVKQQLQSLGATNIKINKGERGKLKITYYSDVDVTSIKNTFSKEKTGLLANTSNNQDNKSEFPLGDTSISYNLDIYEIQNGGDADWDFEGTRILEFKSKTNRFLNPNVYSSVNKIVVSEETHATKVACKVYAYIAISIGDNLYTIPEVRAGPMS